MNENPGIDIPEIDIEGARKLLEAQAATFIDVRDPGSFAESHVPGARNILDATVEAFVAGEEKKRPLVVYCYLGHSSLGGAAYFLDRGFEEVYSMTGGFESWRLAFPHLATRRGERPSKHNSSND